MNRRSFSGAAFLAVGTLLICGRAATAAITATTYPFSTTTGVTLEDMSSGAGLLIGGNQDDVASPVFSIGFDFWFDGTRCTQFSGSSNGECQLGLAGISGTPFNGLASTIDAPKLAPYWDDLRVGTNGVVRFKVIGSAPNRKLVIEWLNMQIPRGNLGQTGAGTFQLWLFETSGVIEFVYGSGIAVNGINGGYSVGIQSGAATNFASVTTGSNTASYTTANDTQPDPIGFGRAYIFTPNVPNAPTNLNFTNVAATSMTVNWTDNATNEAGYAVYQSIDGTTYTFFAQTASNATSRVITGLSPSTNYFFKVFAVTEGAASTALTGSQATNANGNISSSVTGGNWSNPVTWIGGIVPSNLDNVTITDGATVIIDTTAQALSVTIGTGGAAATLLWDAAAARTLTVGMSVTIASNGAFQSAGTGTVTTHSLSLSGDLVNNGVLDFSTNSNTAAAGITFTGANNSNFGGTGTTTDIRMLTVNKTSGGIVELNPSNFTVQGLATDVAGFLSLTNGIFKLSGNFTMTNRVFPVGAYVINAGTEFWLNNPNFTVAGQFPTGNPFAAINNGFLRISQGTFNVGIVAGNSMNGGMLSSFIIEGGTFNITGRLNMPSSVTYTQSGGAVNIANLGNSSSTAASFSMPSGTFNMSGGSINLVQAATGSLLDYNVAASTNITGGTLNVGTGATTNNFTFTIQGIGPELIVDNTNNNKTVQIPNGMTVFGNTTIKSGSALALDGLTYFALGPTFTNNGIIIGDFGGTLSFEGGVVQTYTGTGTVTSALTSFDVDNFNGVIIDPAVNQIVTLRINLFNGGLANANKLTLGDGSATTATVQIGDTAQNSAPGFFDAPPIFNLGTGGEALVYVHTGSPRATGNEINPSRILASLSVNNLDMNNMSQAVTLAGGDLTVSATGTALTLTNGRFVSGSGTLILSSPTATVTRTNGYIDGNLRKTFSGAGTKNFEVGTSTGYSPVTINMTAGTFPLTITARTDSGIDPNYPGLLSALKRYWTIAAPVSSTANLTFQYLITDVLGNEAAYQVVRDSGGFSAPASSVNTSTHVGTVNGAAPISGAWTLIEKDGDFDGMPDSYENAHGLNPNNGADASTDADGDGQSNLAEYLAGTDPQNANSVLRITGISRNGSNVTVSFNAVANKSYRLEYKNAINDAVWQPVSDLTPNMTGTAQITDATAAGNMRLYRMRLLLP
jgi:hypothetical protein